MPTQFLLIDFENIQKVSIAALPEDSRVFVFLGRNQKSIPVSLVRACQKLGDRLEWVNIEGDGPNNLDFHLCYRLGTLVPAHPGAAFYILSHDKGFEPLLAHLRQQNVDCRRIGTLSEMDSANGHPTPELARAITLLEKTPKLSRPRKLATLRKYLTAHFLTVPSEKIEEILTTLLHRQLVTESAGILTYAL